jgi:hypothetical protein
VSPGSGGFTELTVRGPTSTGTVTPIPADAYFLAIVFSLGSFMPAIPLARLVDRTVTLPAATAKSVWLDGPSWEIPTPGNAGVYSSRLTGLPKYAVSTTLDRAE